MGIQCIYFYRYYTTEELIALVEDEDFWQADIFITPPDDGQESAEDSGDDDECNDVNKLSGRQLMAQAEAKITDKGNTFTIGAPDDDDDDGDDVGQPSIFSDDLIGGETSTQNTNFGDTAEYDDEDLIPLAELKKRFAVAVERKWEKKTDLVKNLPDFLQPKALPQIPTDPVSCFELYFDDDVCQFLVEMTMRYGANQKENHAFTTNIDEMRCFLGILLLSGYTTIPRWRMWWEIGTETCNTQVVNAMRRNRFEQIKRYLHCCDNNTLPKDDKFAKMRPLITMLNNRFLKWSEFQEKLSIDESMVPYFGKHGSKQFLKGKPIRYGYKMWCLCEPLGYLMQFEPYQGAKKGEKKIPSSLGVGGTVVLNLLEKLPRNTSFKIYGDRFFSSLKLVHCLQQKGIGYTGTIKYNRIEKCPISSSKIMEKKQRGFYDYCTDTNNNVTVTSWHDNRIVLVISTCDSTLPEKQADRWVSSEKKKIPVSQPNAVSQYNKFMGGVDRMDENIDNYRVAIRSKKWWWAVFAFCLDTSIHNAWQLYRKGAGKKLDYLYFRREIVQTYLQKYGTPRVGGGRPVTHKTLPSRVPEQVRFDRMNHWIVPAEKQNRCAVCKKNSTRACEKCRVNLHDGCFKTFHVI